MPSSGAASSLYAQTLMQHGSLTGHATHLWLYFLSPWISI